MGECLSFDEVLTLARKGRRARNYYALMRHVVSCPACRRTVLQARALVRAQRPSVARWLQRWSFPRPQVWALSVGVAALALAFFLWHGRIGEQNQVASLTTPDKSGEPLASVATSTPATPLDDRAPADTAPRLADTRPSLPPAPPRTPATLAAPSSQRELRMARQLPAFVREAVRLLNDSVVFATRTAHTAATPWLEFVQPDLQRNCAITADTVHFQWSPVPDAESYQLTLRQVDGGIVAEAQLSAQQTSYALSEPLQVGQYEVVISVIAAEKPARVLRRKFYVLDAEQQRAYEWAQSHAETLPLLSAAVFYLIDRDEDALRCIERAAQRYPDDERVRQWREVIQARITSRTAEFQER